MNTVVLYISIISSSAYLFYICRMKVLLMQVLLMLHVPYNMCISKIYKYHINCINANKIVTIVFFNIIGILNYNNHN